MTAEVVNLRQARKRKLREQKAASAAASRGLSGRSKAARRLDEATKRQEKQKLDGLLRVVPATAKSET